jgi:hypothetical protein
MKRCPKCEFVYEDDQRFCDMDGIELAFNSRPLTSEENASLEPAVPPAKSQRRSLALVAVIAALGTLLFVGYHTFRHATAPKKTNQSPAKVTNNLQLAPNPEIAQPAATATPSPSPSPIRNLKAANTTSPNVNSSEARSRTSASKQEKKQPRPESANQKKESKVGSILKKTGRFLKKPFKS